MQMTYLICKLYANSLIDMQCNALKINGDIVWHTYWCGSSIFHILQLLVYNFVQQIEIL